MAFFSLKRYLFGFFSSLDRWIFLQVKNLGTQNHERTDEAKDWVLKLFFLHISAHICFHHVWSLSLNFDYICRYFSKFKIVKSLYFFIFDEKQCVSYLLFCTLWLLVDAQSVELPNYWRSVIILEHTVPDSTDKFFLA